MIDQNTALIVIDVQTGFDDPFWGRRNNPDAEARMAHLLTAWRLSGRPVIHVHHESPAADGLLRADALKAVTEPRPTERRYVKRVNSAFIGTTLEADLRAEGVSTVVLIGLTTNHCVSTSARMAGNLGFRTIVVSDATATFERQGLDGRMRTADEVHASALSDLRDEFATIMSTAEVLAAAEPRAAAYA